MNHATLPAIEDLSNCRLPELQGYYAQVVGEPTRCPNKKFLIRRIKETLEEQAQLDQEAVTATSIEGEPLPPEEPTSEEALDGGDEATEAEDTPAPNKSLTKLSVAELQQVYVDVVGRPTGSSHRRYLIWKIRQAQKGKIPVGPRNRRDPNEPTPEFKILPIRMEADLVERVDEARERLGLKSRMDLFRSALHVYLDQRGETEVAALFAPRA